MLGWAGGAAGVAAQIPDTVAIGEAPPATKPRPGSAEGAATEPLPTSNVEGLFEKKLSKEEKKKLAEERRKARKAAKEGAKKDASDEDGDNISRASSSHDAHFVVAFSDITLPELFSIASTTTTGGCRKKIRA
eukprot:scaffold448_cov156-Amphora_coffeaeformis.AAC.1